MTNRKLIRAQRTLTLACKAGLAAVLMTAVAQPVWAGRDKVEAVGASQEQAPHEGRGAGIDDRATLADMDRPAPSWHQDRDRGLSHLRQMDPRFDEGAFQEECTDRFFQIQAAWMRRDLAKLRPLLTEEMQAAFAQQIEAAQVKQQINKLENITVRSVELTEAWQEQGQDYVTVRILANLLDYTVDEPTGRVVNGSDSEPVKFEEFWTWVRPVGPNAWRLSAINQAA